MRSTAREALLCDAVGWVRLLHVAFLASLATVVGLASMDVVGNLSSVKLLDSAR